MCLVQQEKFWSEIFEMKIIFLDPAECYNFRSVKKKKKQKSIKNACTTSSANLKEERK